MIWKILPQIKDFSFDPAQGPSATLRVVASLDTALEEFRAEALTFEVRGKEVSLEEFRKLADEASGAPGDFVVLGANRERRVESF